jgi:hypothetical protein
LAWVFIGVVTLAVLLGVAGCVMTLTDRATDEVWDPTATSTPVLTGTPVPTAGPSATPTVWYQEMETPTVAATEVVTAAYPAWWSDQMTQDEEGNWWPPEEVDAMVKENFRASMDAYEQAFPDGDVPDLDLIEAVYLEWYSGPQLETELFVLEDQRQGGLIFKAEIDFLYLDVQNWSVAGTECTLGATYQGIESRGYNALTGELMETTEMDSQLVLWRMRYDSGDGHWKVHELVDFYNN